MDQQERETVHQLVYDNLAEACRIGQELLKNTDAIDSIILVHYVHATETIKYLLHQIQEDVKEMHRKRAIGDL